MKTDNLKHQAILVVLGDGISVASALIGTIFLTRMLGQNEMGTWQQVLYLTVLLPGILELGLSTTVYRYWVAFRSTPEIQACYARMLLVCLVVLGGVSATLLFVSSGFFGDFYDNPQLGIALTFAALTPLGTIPFRAVRPLMICEGESLRATLLETAFAVCSTGSLVMACWLGFEVSIGIGLRAMVSILFGMLLPIVLLKQLSGPGEWWNWDVLSTVWNFVWPIQFSRLPGMLMQYADKVVMSFCVSPQQFAIYALGARELPFIGQIGHSISSVVLPKLVENAEREEWEQLKSRWGSAANATAMLTYPIGAMCVFFPEQIMRLLFSSTYSESAQPFQVFSVLTFLRVVEYASLAKAFGKSDLIFKSSLLSCGTMMLLSYPLAYAFQGIGMAVCLVLSNCSAIVYLLYSYSKLVPGRVREFFPWPRLLTLALLALLSGLSCKLLFSQTWNMDGLNSEFGLAFLLSSAFGLLVVFYSAFLVAGGLLNLRQIRLQVDSFRLQLWNLRNP